VTEGDKHAVLPSGLRWRLTARFTERSRRRRYELFRTIMRPRPEDLILDVGVTDTAWRSGNFLEANYPLPSQITAVALQRMPGFEREHPAVRFVAADGRALPFPDDAFDIGFSNAVIEHVGSRADQARFVSELVRTCRRVFISTPNRAFPLDPHTLLPFVHWLDQPMRGRVYRMLGQGRWAGDSTLNPLTRGDFLRLFPPDAPVRIISQRVMGLTTVLIALADRGAAQPGAGRTESPGDPRPTAPKRDDQRGGREGQEPGDSPDPT
jgi:SAM-dependent methyltransferase